MAFSLNKKIIIICVFLHEIGIRNPASLQSVQYIVQNIKYGFHYTGHSSIKNR